MAAPDFYFCLNATFRFVHDKWGEQALVDFWRALGREHYAPVTQRFRDGGLEAVQDYWQALFDEEPGGDVSVRLDGAEVVIDVRVCPAIRHLREHGRDIMPMYCDHCAVVSQAMCEGAGIEVSVEGGGGNCVQRFRRGGTVNGTSPPTPLHSWRGENGPRPLEAGGP